MSGSVTRTRCAWWTCSTGRADDWLKWKFGAQNQGLGGLASGFSASTEMAHRPTAVPTSVCRTEDVTFGPSESAADSVRCGQPDLPRFAWLSGSRW